MTTTRNVDTVNPAAPETSHRADTTTLRLVRPNPNSFLSREQVLDAAEACFEQGGYDGVTIRAIARQLGCSVGAIYRYFDDKRAMLLALGDRLFAPAIAEAERPDGLSRSTALWLGVAEQRPELYRLLFMLSVPDRPPVIGQLVDRWAVLTGSPDRAARRFAMGHGLLMLGRSAGAIAELLDTAPKRPAGKSVAPAAPTLEAPVVVDAVPVRSDDVTLL